MRIGLVPLCRMLLLCAYLCPWAHGYPEPRMYTTLSTLTVIRNASPLILLGAEHFMFGVPITKDAILSLAIILIGWVAGQRVDDGFIL